MAEIILGTDTNPGGRKYNEDRTGTDSFVSKGGLHLSVAVVCDGVGGEERGERAAQLAIDTIFAYMRSSDISETPRLLNAAVKAANLAAYNEAQRLRAGERMACTLVAGVVENNQTLYIANVGDSRIYLAREGRLLQLTRDHTFANVMVWMGKLSPQAAASNPDATKVMRVLGTKPDIQVDMGFYLNTTEYGEANKIGRLGLKLSPSDSIVLCTDGLVKNTATTGQPLVMDKEMVNVLQADEGPKAARGIMSIALGRIPVGEPVDNITLALIQTEDPSRAVHAAKIQKLQEQKQQSEVQRKMILIAAGVGIPACIVLSVLLAVIAGGSVIFKTSSEGTATQLAKLTQVALAQTQTVGAYTLTPSPTATETPVPPTTVPTLAAGEIAKLYQGESLLEILVDNKKSIMVPNDETRFIAVNRRGEGENGNIHLLGGAQFQLSGVNEPNVNIQTRILGVGSDVFFQTGPYANGADVELASSAIALRVKGCLTAYYADARTLLADCFKGECALSTNFGSDFTSFAAGQQIKVNIEQLKIDTQGNIPRADELKYWALLIETSAGRQDAKRCSVPPPATPTPRPTFTPTPNVAATEECRRLQQVGTPCH